MFMRLLAQVDDVVTLWRVRVLFAREAFLSERKSGERIPVELQLSEFFTA